MANTHNEGDLHGTAWFDVPEHKLPFDIYLAMQRIRIAIRPYPEAALFELANEGFTSIFEQIIACIISIRTYDETTLITARGLFSIARSPEELAKLSIDRIDQLIRPCTFHEAKSKQISEIAKRITSDYGGNVPHDPKVIAAFPGVGIKCTNLVLGIACGEPHVAVDIHVHRVTNRWGYVHTKSSEETTKVLEEKLPEVFRVDINRYLVPFGKHICTGKLPKCSTCPVIDMCQQVGVSAHR